MPVPLISLIRPTHLLHLRSASNDDERLTSIGSLS
jgi:hypothetical protein